jgi:predicted adenylyl cyclase CyaB
MPYNIEIKAKVKDMAKLKLLAESLASEPCITLYQEDIFFQSNQGRLKLRTFSNNNGELIFYERPDIKESKQSYYQIIETANPKKLRQLLAAALGETITVKKKREVYLVGQTRVHLDEVEELGSFMELEVVLNPNQNPLEGQRIASDLMAKLGVNEADLVSCAYADLLYSKKKN